MGRWTDEEEDRLYLPEGVTRVGYDSETQIYTFQDAKGNKFRGEPRQKYGTLHPFSYEAEIEKSRPGAFDTGRSRPQPNGPGSQQPSVASFHDFLPATSIGKAEQGTPAAAKRAKRQASNGTDESPNPSGQHLQPVRKKSFFKQIAILNTFTRNTSGVPLPVGSPQSYSDGGRVPVALSDDGLGHNNPKYRTTSQPRPRESQGPQMNAASRQGVKTQSSPVLG